MTPFSHHAEIREQLAEHYLSITTKILTLTLPLNYER